MPNPNQQLEQMLKDAQQFTGGAEITLIDTNGYPAITYTMTSKQIISFLKKLLPLGEDSNDNSCKSGENGPH